MFTFLVFQKVQLLPNIGILLSIVLFFENLKLENRKLLATSVIILFLSSTFKYSFFINTFSVMFSLFLLNIFNKKFYKLIPLVLFVSLFTIMPMLLKNYYFFGDPLSPFFEFLKSTPDKNIVEFSKVLGSDTYGDFMSFSAITILFFPFFLSFSNKLYFVNHLLGIGIIYLYYFLFNKISYVSKNVRFLITIVLINFLIYVFVIKQLTPRYYLDIYFLLGILLIINFNHIKKNLLSKFIILLMKIEVCLFLMLLIFGVLFLSTASISTKSYDKFMKKSADGYSEAIWADEVLPKNAVYFSENSRSHALFPRKFISIRELIGDENFDFKKLIEKENITHMIASYPLEHSNNKIRKIIKECPNYKIIDRKKFNRGVRNPFSNWKGQFDLVAVELKC